MNTDYRPVIAFNDNYGWIKEVYNNFSFRNKYTKNEIRVYESGICEIDVYDIYGAYKDTAIFSECDLQTMLPHKWYKDNTGYLSTTINGKKVRAHKLILPEGIADHYDNNKLNNTRENLQQVTQSVNIAKITNKMSNKFGVTGIYITRSNTWSAHIEVNKKRYNKNFKTKEEAILQRYIWEINFWGRNAPQLNKIKEQYPRLLYALKDNILVNNDVEIVDSIIKKLELSPFCPCKIIQSNETRCPCKEFREQNENGECHCGLYVKIE